MKIQLQFDLKALDLVKFPSQNILPRSKEKWQSEIEECFIPTPEMWRKHPFNICPLCRKKVPRNEPKIITDRNIRKNQKKIQWWHVGCGSNICEVQKFYTSLPLCPVNQNTIMLIL